MKKLYCFIAGIVLGANLSAPAVTYWSNTGTGFWNEPTNWVGGAIPIVGDDVRINNGGTAIIDSSMNVSLALAVMADTNGTSGTLRMTGGTLTTTSDIRVGGNTTTVPAVLGVFDQSGGVVTLNGGNFNVGIGAGSVGNYNVSGGSVQMSSINTTTPIFAVGNRNTGIVNQSGGTIYLRSTNGLSQLGRNTTATTGFGTYNLSGGTLATSRLQFGNAVGIVGSTNTFTLSTNGILITGSISNINTTAINTFNFTGGTLSVMTCAISLTNNGGTLSPAAIDFASAAGTNFANLPISAVGTNVFNSTNNYVQNAGGNLVVDIASAGNNDFVDIGSGVNVGNATIAGTISVRLINGYSPAVGTTFDILAADLVSNSATISAGSDSAFSSSIVTGGDGRQVLRLTVTKQGVVTPQLTGATKLGNGSFQFSFTNSVSHTFTVWSTTNLSTAWSSLGSAVETTSGQYQFIDTQANSLNQRFYQVRWP